MQSWKKFAVAPLIAVLCLLLTFGTAPGTAVAAQPAPQATPEPAPAAPAIPPTMVDPPPDRMIGLPWSDPSVRIPPPRQLRAGLPATANFSINYLTTGSLLGANCIPWDPAAQAAFDYAASVWGSRLNSSVPIRLDACYGSLGNTGILGQGGPTFLLKSGALYWYPNALEDAIAGQDQDTARADIFVTMNSSASWYFGTDTNVPLNKYDFVSVALHEIGHGLGFSGSIYYGNPPCNGANYGCWGVSTIGQVSVFDKFIQSANGYTLIDESNYPNNSSALGSQLTSGNLIFGGANATVANGNQPAKIYAPPAWSGGSSLYHLDTSYQNTTDAVLVPSIAMGSYIHDAGPVTMGILQDLGWNRTPPTPKPIISQLIPSTATQGGPDFLLTVNGSNFVQSSVVHLGSSPKATNFVNSTQLTAQISSGDLANSGTVYVTVVNPAPGGASNALPFVIQPQAGNPLPSISQLSPSSAAQGGPGFTLTVDGSNFIQSSVVRWGGSPKTTNFVSSTQLTAQISTADLASSGRVNVTVVNPAPGGGESTSLPFLIGQQLFLPVLVKSPPAVGSIAGRLTYQNAGIGGLKVELRQCTSPARTACSLYQQANTASDGSYSFVSPAALPAGQVYYVRFLNSTSVGNPQNSAYLAGWYSDNITGYTTGSQITGITFDIANMMQVSPAHDASVGLPTNFAWQRRPATPGDSYTWEVFGLNGDTAVFETNLLGYVNSYRLTTLPGGFAAGTRYGWDMWVRDAKGWGLSFYYFYVRFNSAGQPPAGVQPGIQVDRTTATADAAGRAVQSAADGTPPER